MATFTQRAHIRPFLHLSQNCGCTLPFSPPTLPRLLDACAPAAPAWESQLRITLFLPCSTTSRLLNTCATAPAARQPRLSADSLPPCFPPLSPDLQTDEDRTQEILAATTRRIKDLGQQGRMKDAIQVGLKHDGCGRTTRRVPPTAVGV